MPQFSKNYLKETRIDIVDDDELVYEALLHGHTSQYGVKASLNDDGSYQRCGYVTVAIKHKNDENSTNDNQYIQIVTAEASSTGDWDVEECWLPYELFETIPVTTDELTDFIKPKSWLTKLKGVFTKYVNI